MDKLSERISGLSPAKRSLIEKRLKEKGKSLPLLQKGKYAAPPLSFAQERLWFLEQFEPGNPANHRPAAFRIKGLLNIDALKKSIDDIVRRHEILRTAFEAKDGRPLQIINSPKAVDIEIADFGDMSGSDREAEAIRRITEEAGRPFDLKKGPLIRIALIRLSGEEHILQLVMHHIIFDGWSSGVFLRELSVLYEAYAKGEASSLPELSIQYADYAIWQRQWLQGEVLKKQLSYWRQKLEGAPPVLELPTDRPRPAVQTYKGARESFLISAELAEGLNVLGRRENATLFMTLLAAFKVLLYRYTGSEDIVIGTPIANRTRVELEDLIGFFVNTLVLRTDLSGGPTFLEVLGRVRETTLEAYTHKDLPFEKLVEELRSGRNLTSNPIFQVMFNLEDIRSENVQPYSLKIEESEFDSGSAPFDLMVEIVNIPEGHCCFFQYNSALFDAGTIKRMTGHFKTLLESVIAGPGQCISCLPILTEAERHLLLVEWNNTGTDYPRDKCIHELFEAQVEKTPDAIAAVFEDQRLTYRQLNERANQLAHYLRRQGVGPEVFVGICVERSMEMIVGILGILKAGGAYVPLDPVYPEERLAFMLEDAQVSILITQAGLRERFYVNNIRSVCIGDDCGLISQESSENVAGGTSPDNLAYVIYTSGSTGRPKGVLVTHYHVVRLFESTHQWFHFNDEDVWTLFHSYAFDFSVWELWGALLHGGRLIVVPFWVGRSLASFLDLLIRQKVTVLNITPSAFRHLMQEEGAFFSEGGLALRFVIFGGEALQVNILKPWFVRHGDRHPQLVNMYGITETTVHVTYRPLRASDIREAVGSPIGRPIPGLKVHILGPYLQPVPIGVPGEIYVGGDGLARGYLNCPELTSENFIRNPFSEKDGSRLYKTGDLARYRPDGNVEFLGRIDDQVKIRGFRIEPGEIESVLGKHPDVKESVVVQKELNGDKSLVAFVVLRDNSVSVSDDMRNFLKEKLPEYMIPSFFMFLDKLPLTPNGKIDRRALPEPDYSRRSSEEEFVPPLTPTEKIIADIWSKVLGIKHVGVHDNFFALGGHSLLATQVISRLNKTFNIDMPLRSFFELPTVRELAPVIEEYCAPGQDSRHNSAALLHVVLDKSPALSYAQKRLWFLDRMDPGNSFYNVSSALRLKGELSSDVLQKSLNEIVRRHEVLRTTFIEQDDSPVQEIHQDMELDIREIDLTGKPETGREAAAADIMTEEAQRPFDLSTGPLLRVVLMRLDDHEHILLITIHHIAYDGWSSGVFFRELSVLYEAYAKGEESPLSELSIQYADYAVWQRQWLRGGVLERQLEYWRGKLEGAPPVLELPTDRPRPAVQTNRGANASFVLSAEVAEDLKALGRKENTTLFMTLLAAFNVLLYRYTGSEDIVIGTPIANRTRVELEELIGFFVNTLVLRTDLSGGPTFREVMGRVREATIEAYSNQDLPFEKLVEELKPQRSLNHSPLFQVMFVLQNAADPVLELSGITLNPIEVERGTSKFDLTLSIAERGEGLEASINYNMALFDAETIVRITGHFQSLLKAVAANPEQRISCMPILTEAESHQILVKWNDTKREYPEDKCIHELFEEQVERMPEAVAVADEEGSMTYRELNRRSNQLAHYLRSLGIRPEVLAGIYMESSIEIIVCLLGILKAGGAYLPLDPLFPKERLKLIIEDSKIPVLLSKSSMKEKIADLPVTVVCLDEETEILSQYPDTNLNTGVTIDNQVYVIYTSGSTGMPKGVVVEQRQLLNYIYGIMESTGMSPGYCYAMLQPLAVDSCKTVIFPPLFRGGTLHVLPRDRASDPWSVAEYFRQHPVDVLKIAPSHLSALLNSMGSVDLLPREILIIGGESLLREQIKIIQELNPHIRIFNHYGPTETTVGTLAYQVSDHKAEEQGPSIPLGRPLPNTRAYLLNKAMQQVPVNVPGEIYIGGSCVTRGYLNKKGLTKERFIPDFFSDKPGARLYRTGDLARYLPDGNIEFLGRIDNQIKIRGYRIEPGEIESAIKRHALVQEALVIGKHNGFGGKHLLAYVVLKQDSCVVYAGEENDSWGNKLTVELRGFINKSLPEYMVPNFFVFLEAFPLTPHGKLDLNALPLPDKTRPELQDAFVLARNPIEKNIAGIWSEVLGIKRIGIYDNFFVLGGHSLLAIQVVSRLNRTFNMTIPLRSFFEAPTIAGLSSLIQDICWQIQGRHLAGNKSDEYTRGEL